MKLPFRFSSKRVLTADFRRLSQIKIRTFHRRDAEYAEKIPFAQSGDDDWAKDLVFKRAMFLFVVVSRQTKNEILCTLCPSTSSGSRAQSRDASAVIFLKGFLSVSICVNLRLKFFASWLSGPVGATRRRVGPTARRVRKTLLK